MTLNVKDFDLKTRFLTKYTKIINVYDQIIGRGYIYLGAYTKKKNYRKYQLKQNNHEKNSIYK